MDKIYNDIHYVTEKEKKTLFCIRQVRILAMSFEKDFIKITYMTGLFNLCNETLVIPKLSFCKLIID